jgi:CRP-like cAMP-binding protein
MAATPQADRAVTLSPLAWLPPELQECSRVRELPAGDALFRRGQKSAAIFLVESGQLRMVRYALDGAPLLLHLAREGELFAEAALFSSAYQCDAVAGTASRVRVYPKRELLAVFRKHPALGERFMAVLARQIHQLRARLEERNIRSARERLLHHLALAAGASGESVPLHGTLIDLATEIGISHEALYRTLAKLENEGIVSRTRSAITLKKTKRI